MKVRLARAFGALSLLGLPAAAADPLLTAAVDLYTKPLDAQPAGTLAGVAMLERVLQAGHPAPDPASGITPDSPSARIDPNDKSSIFAGVGSIFTDADPTTPGGVICTGTPISDRLILTAAHCFDTVDNDGRSDVLPGNALFVLNYGESISHIIPAESIWTHPDYAGGTDIHDDIAIMRLSEPLPAGVPIYPLADPDWIGYAPVLLAGYGESGDGVSGYYVDADFSVRRVGANILEYFEADDEGSGLIEIAAFDFEYEGDPTRYDVFGLPIAFPNDIETMLGSGDSGGPSFMLNPNDPSDLTLYLAMVNTFSFAFTGVPDHDIRGRFGSGSGGVFLNSAYQDWIYNTAVIPETTTWIAGAALATISFAAARARRRKSGH